MNVFYTLLSVFLITTQSYGYVVEDRKSAEDGEPKIVIQSLSKRFGDGHAHRTSANSELTDNEDVLNPDEEKEPNFVYKPNKFVYPSDVSPDAKPPLAVPPTDFRYYQKDFSVSPTIKAPSDPMALHIDDNVDALLNKKLQQRISSDGVHVVENVPSSRLYGLFFYGNGSPQHGFDYHWNGSGLSPSNMAALIYGFTCGFITILIIAAVLLVRNMKQKMIDAEEVDYPAYGVTGPNKDTPAPTGDRNLAHSAQMYHFHHQKSQIIAMEKESKPNLRKGTESGSEEDEAVYECPGLAPVTGEMEVNNPLFHEEEVKSPTVSKDEKDRKPQLEEKKNNKK